jgi:restriction system-associated AAA family ATPase
MKLIKIVVNNPNGFRGLPNGFTIPFREIEDRNEIDPICLAGLNGSGKSNILELISEIFFHLEAAHHETAKNYITKKAPFGFYLEYETKVTANNLLQSDSKINVNSSVGSNRKVTITKKPQKEAVIKFLREGEWITLNKESLSYDYNVSQLLPSKIIAYSSGQNELISNPFLRMDFFYFDQYLKELEDGYNKSEILENRLFFMDYDSNAFVLLSNFLLRDKPGSDEQKELNILREMIAVSDIDSFEIVLNLRVKKEIEASQLSELLEGLRGLDSKTIIGELETQLFWDIILPPYLVTQLENLEKCSTYTDIESNLENDSERWVKVHFYFKDIDHNTKSAFQDKFRNGLRLFRQLYLLNLLNIYNYSDNIRENVKKSKSGTSENISDLIPKMVKDDKVFYIKNLKLRKSTNKKDFVYYKNLSDGEHQFLHIIGTLMLMEEESTIFLLDEPSTHFNADWSAKFIYTANRIHELRKNRVGNADLANQLVMLSTHSPFVLSDSKSANIFWLNRENGKPVIQDLDFETYGASIDFIMKRIAKMRNEQPHLIPLRAYEELTNIIENGSLVDLTSAIEKFGNSSVKQFLYRQIEDKLPD